MKQRTIKTAKIMHPWQLCEPPLFFFLLPFAPFFIAENQLNLTVLCRNRFATSVNIYIENVQLPIIRYLITTGPIFLLKRWLALTTDWHRTIIISSNYAEPILLLVHHSVQHQKKLNTTLSPSGRGGGGRRGICPTFPRFRSLLKLQTLHKIATIMTITLE